MGHLLCYFAQLQGYIWVTHTWIVDIFLSYCRIHLVILLIVCLLQD